ncbi:MAG: alkaline phosphatase [Alphaproteobacteria bacterium]|jgi:alkaline phosphatase D|nr:alkaline phosphatase [Alphaproteobacteria bacterium]
MARLEQTPRLLFDRRAVLKGALGAGIAASGFYPLTRASAQISFKTYPFSLGVASGEPAADGFVLWTRLAPEPANLGGGIPPVPVEVTWEVAADSGMKQVLRSGKAIARAEVAHSLHVEIDGLDPARDYFYRFRAGGADSPIGRSRTLPGPGADVAQLRFASAGCQAWEGGFYTAWRRIAEENFDFVFHYGDYIYEHARYLVDRNKNPLPRAMPEGFRTCVNLIDYRRRYGLYKSDPDLQAAHASCPFLPSFDDHEVTDNWAADTDPKDTPAEAFLFRRAAAFQAWYEHMPVRRSMLPRGPDMLAYRNLGFGKLADVAVLDTRQFRSKQPCGDGIKAACKEADEPSRTMMGEPQERWLAERLRSTKATWQVLAQQVLFAQMDWRSFEWAKASDVAVDLDGWDGATAARNRVISMFAPTANPVVLTGDAHMALALEIKEDWKDPKSRCLGVEFLATSISSGGDGSAALENKEALHAQNPHLKFSGNERGYTRHTVTPKQWRADHRVVEKVSTRDAPILTRKSLVVEAGRPGLNDA